MSKIDFVITWVDGNDPKWQAEKKKYQSSNGQDNRNVRYRDYELLKYWFRAVDKYANWVNKIYFVTYGHIPSWLNIDNKKLVIVNHKDFIPSEYLPTFNSCTIELNIHRIKGLSENFVYFNDDVFINNYVKETDFFKNNLPCDSAILSAIVPSGHDNFEHRLINNMNVINKHFNMKDCIRKNKGKWFNLKYGKEQIRTLLLLSFSNFPSIKYSHTAMSFKKTNFKTLWKLEPSIMNNSCVDKFRSFFGVNPWVILNWQMASGNFMPRKVSFSKFYVMTDKNEEIIKDIKENNHKIICLNDSDKIKNFDKVKSELINAFESKLNEKSSYER